jgi:hypothetical protein
MARVGVESIQEHRHERSKQPNNLRIDREISSDQGSTREILSSPIFQFSPTSLDDSCSDDKDIRRFGATKRRAAQLLESIKRKRKRNQ